MIRDTNRACVHVGIRDILWSQLPENKKNVPLQYILLLHRLLGCSNERLCERQQLLIKLERPLRRKLLHLCTIEQIESAISELFTYPYEDDDGTVLSNLRNDVVSHLKSQQLPRSSNPSSSICQNNDLVGEVNVRCSQSQLWQQQKDFYHKLGLIAWTDSIVPFGISSNAFIASRYAEIAIEFFSTSKSGGYVLEAGAGQCQFGFLFVKHFFRLWKEYNKDNLKPTVILTDCNEQVLEACMALEGFKPYLEDGLVDFALWDVDDTKNATLELKNQKRTLDLKSLGAASVFVIANYFLDSLGSDVFMIQGNGSITEGLLSSKCSKRSGKVISSSVQVSCSNLQLCDNSIDTYYSEQYLNEILCEVLSDALKNTSLENQSQLILFPVQAIRWLHKLHSCCCVSSSFGILVGDASYMRSNAAWHVHDSEPIEIPQLTPHANCFCLPLDFTALSVALKSAAFWQQSDAEMLVSKTEQTCSSFTVLLGSRKAQHSGDHITKHLGQVGVSDVDLFTGWLLPQIGTIELSIQAFSQILEFVAWDFQIFKALRWHIINMLKAVVEREESTRDIVLKDALKCYSNLYCLSSRNWTNSKFEMASWLYVFGAYTEALEILQTVTRRSEKYYQRSVFLSGLCYFKFGNKRAAELKFESCQRTKRIDRWIQRCQ